VFVGVGILAAAGVTLTALLRRIEHRLAPWQEDARAAP
jgi:ABC-type nitrate/sulfonate/bicarbonate transport system permease component